MHKTIKLPFCTLDIRNRVVTATINEGVHLTLGLSEEMVIAVFDSIGDKPTVYLTNRVNSYSVDPTLYTNISKIENIIGFGIISHVQKKSSYTEIEKLFYNKKFQHFDDIETAFLWAEKKLESHNKLVN